MSPCTQRPDSPATGRCHALALVLIMGLYCVVAASYAWWTPAWQNPDEPAHYNYIRYLATTQRVPHLQPGDYDQALIERLLSRRFPGEIGIDALRYENHQPPLYYLLQAPVYRLFDGKIRPLRLVSVILGLGIVVLAYRTVRLIDPGRPGTALATAALVAFIPQHVAMMAAVNNDALAELLAAATLYLALQRRYRPRFSAWRDLAAGLLLGLGFITKLTAYPVLVVVITAYLWPQPEHSRTGLPSQPVQGRGCKRLVGVLTVAVLIGLPWWLHNGEVYGWPDILGLRQHATVVAGQPRTVDWIARHGLTAWAWRAVVFTFQSFWGQFGWMAVPLPSRVYQIFMVLTVAALVGMVSAYRRPPEPWHRGAPLLLASIAATALAYIAFNASLVQHQGRYLFPALIPLAFFFVRGLAELTGFHLRSPGLIRSGSALAGLGGLVLLDFYALFRWIGPALK